MNGERQRYSDFRSGQGILWYDHRWMLPLDKTAKQQLEDSALGPVERRIIRGFLTLTSPDDLVIASKLTHFVYADTGYSFLRRLQTALKPLSNRMGYNFQAGVAYGSSGKQNGYVLVHMDRCKLPSAHSDNFPRSALLGDLSSPIVFGGKEIEIEPSPAKEALRMLALANPNQRISLRFVAALFRTTGISEEQAKDKARACINGINRKVLSRYQLKIGDDAVGWGRNKQEGQYFLTTADYIQQKRPFVSSSRVKSLTPEAVETQPKREQPPALEVPLYLVKLAEQLGISVEEVQKMRRRLLVPEKE